MRVCITLQIFYFILLTNRGKVKDKKASWVTFSQITFSASYTQGQLGI